jgi:putative tryptophan/tyrosine transport system substrate-binding protein
MLTPQILVQLRRMSSLLLNKRYRLGWPGIILLGSMLWPALALAAPTIHILIAEPGGIYQEAASSLSQGLSRGNWDITVSTPARNTSSSDSDLTVAIGTKALEAALARPGRPILSLLVPRSTYERLALGQQQLSALYLDQPLSRQLHLLGIAGFRQVGVPLGLSSRQMQNELQTASQESGIQVGSALIERGTDLQSALTDLARDNQAFLLLPDPMVAQRGTLQNFFLHTYRLKKPVLAYSAPLAQSGALLALYATPAQLGEEAAGWIREGWGRGEFRLGPSRYPRRFTISVNRTVARSLDIVLPSEDALTRQLGAMP